MVANSEDVRESATQLLQKKQNESTVFSEEAENAVPKFNPHGKFSYRKRPKMDSGEII